jgi:hypothetical protein
VCARAHARARAWRTIAPSDETAGEAQSGSRVAKPHFRFPVAASRAYMQKSSDETYRTEPSGESAAFASTHMAPVKFHLLRPVAASMANKLFSALMLVPGLPPLTCQSDHQEEWVFSSRNGVLPYDPTYIVLPSREIAGDA